MFFIRILFLFILFQKVFLIKLNNKIFENLENDKNNNLIIEKYVNWLLQMNSFSKINSKVKEENCWEIIILNNSSDLIFKELLFNEFLLKKLNDRTVKFYTKYKFDVLTHGCDTLVFIAFGDRIKFKELKKFTTTRKSKNLLILLPSPTKYHKNITDWPANIFIHSNVIGIISNKIYKLSTPYDIKPREFIEIFENTTNDWPNYEPEIGGYFNGKQLRASTLNCPPLNYWKYQASHSRSEFPEAGDSEIMCRNKTRVFDENGRLCGM